MLLNHLKQVASLGLAEADRWRVDGEGDRYLILVRGEASLWVVILPAPTTGVNAMHRSINNTA